MKKPLMYIVIFALIFINITALMIYLNAKYNNIFEFDFRPKPEDDMTVLDTPEMESLKIELKQQILDSLAIEQAKTDSIEIAENNPETVKKNNQPNPLAENKEFVSPQENDYDKEMKEKAAQEAYNTWKKKTAAMYENMDPGKAAKIIEKYSDNVARDILYSMNKKKAAQILAALNPEFANEITKAK